MFKSKILICLPFLWAFNSNASLIITESSDFSENLVSPTFIYQTLGVGKNYISGSVDYLTADLYDSFTVNLMPNTEITHILFQAFDISASDKNNRIAYGFMSMLNDVNYTSGLNAFYPEPSAKIAESSYNSNTAPSFAFDFSHRTFAALSGASYFDNIKKEWSLYPAESGTSKYNWQYTFTVSNLAQVPEPSSIILMFLGLSVVLVQYRKGKI